MLSGVSLPARRRRQPAENDARHAAAKLLVYNRLHQRLEIRVAEFDTILAHAVDNSGKHRVAAA